MGGVTRMSLARLLACHDSALLRELQTKGEQARFVKAGRGKFALRDHGAVP